MDDKEMVSRFQDWLGLPPAAASMVVEDVIWALARDPELREEYIRRINAAAADFAAAMAGD